MNEENKNWKEMSEQEKSDIIDDTNNRLLEAEMNRKEAAKQRVKEIASGKCMWSVAELGKFINKVNSLAKRHGCLHLLPTRTFPSREEFLVEAITVLLDHGVPEEEIEKIKKINEDVNKSRM
jgi:hypothetical protein